jgi:hypothetical protein
MKKGTRVRLPDGREGVTVYHHLDGYGIRWVEPGEALSREELNKPPQAMLRDPYPAARAEGLECVGEEFEIVGQGEDR